MKTENDLCQFMDWDSRFFGVRIAMLLPATLSAEILDAAFSWCRANEIDCLYFLADSKDRKTVRLSEDNDFNLTDVRVTLGVNLENASVSRAAEKLSISKAAPEDVTQLKQIASVSHYDSRFYYDENFPTELCDRLYATWIEKSCEGFANAVLVAKSGETVEGYITCSIDGRTGSIGLVGVNPNCRGKGIGGRLVGSSLEWFAENKVSKVTVVTQGRNVNAQRLYQKNGFTIESLALWYHKWFDR